jgi:hypothetical protein
MQINAEKYSHEKAQKTQRKIRRGLGGIHACAGTSFGLWRSELTGDI